jgi:glyoxylase-like metal-dependent hydrolase (beta-lactamase superfamily II)
MKIFILMAILAAGMSACSSEIVVQKPESSSYKVLPVNMGHVKLYFIQTDDGYILVDTGKPDKGKELDEAFSKAGINPKNVKLIVITHAHPDHSGTVAHAKEITGAKILCHESAARFIRDGKSSPIVAHNLKGKIMNAISPKWKYQGVEPDILIKKEFDLDEYGIDGKVIHTPGHTEDSITIVLDNGEMILGDLVRGKDPDINLGQFYEDKGVLIQSLKKLAAYQAKMIYMSHGKYIDNETFQRNLDAMKE